MLCRSRPEALEGYYHYFLSFVRATGWAGISIIMLRLSLIMLYLVLGYYYQLSFVYGRAFISVFLYNSFCIATGWVWWALVHRELFFITIIIALLLFLTGSESGLRSCATLGIDLTVRITIPDDPGNQMYAG